MTNYTDTTKLIDNCREGDLQSVEILIRRYQDEIYWLALSVLTDPMEARDAAQDAFICALGALDSYQGNASFKTWLYAIALNTSRSRLRKRKTLERLKNTLQSLFRVQWQKLPTPEEAVIQNEKDQFVWQALEKLKTKHRLPMILRYYHDLSNAEIADILHINEGTVCSRLHHAREQLRAEFEKQPGFFGE
jgi:RNA polymerase sigma-70 factor, ECF subfamily